jgi:tetratricopeptide (TPR) repeat protein
MFCPQCGAAADSSGRCPSCGGPTGIPITGGGASGVAPTGTGTIEPPDDDATRTSPSSAALGAWTGTGRLRPGHQFSSRYTIIRSLGVGGMGAVYQAWDQTLGTAVALKIIRVDEATHPFDVQQLEERFKRELRLARQVTHPNVVRIHDLGEFGAVKYLTMAYVEGQDLASLLRTHGKLPVERALAIARQICAGLAAAHAAGVVHRDLKPANVLIDGEQHALLTDFGIARAVDAATLHTLPGEVIGTLAYMAPEQARGEVADQRSDAYSFGLILYELLAGGRPRSGTESALADLVARVQQGPPPLRQIAAAVPVALEQIVNRCLQKDPTARYQNAAELLADLNRLDTDGTLALQAPPTPAARRRWMPLVAALVVVAALVSATWWVAGRRAMPTTFASRPPLSVLIADFENKAGEQVFQGSLEQALGIAIEGAPFITSFSRKDAADRAQELRPGSRLDLGTAQLVARREGIAVILAGSIEWQGTGYRLQIRVLKSAQGEKPQIVETTAPDKSGVLDAVGRLAGQIRTALGDTTPSAELQGETYSTSSLEAVHEYSVAQGLTTDSKNEEAIPHYRKAVEADPQFGRAYAGWAVSAWDLGRLDDAEQLWTQALSHMDRMTDREKYRALGGYFLSVARNYDKAIENYRLLVKEYPADLAGRNNLAVAYFYTLDFAKALEEGGRAIEIYPKSLKFRANYALYAMYAGDFKTAVDSAQQVLKADPTYDTGYLPLAIAAVASGDVAAARAAYERARAAGSAGVSLANVGLADLALYQGRFSDAVSMLEAAIPLDDQRQNTLGAASKSLVLAEALAALGQPAAAVRAAERGLTISQDEFVAVPATRVFAAASQGDRAARLARDLMARGQPLQRSYASIITGEQALRRGSTGDAIAAFSEALKAADVWLARFDRGVAYVEAGRHAEAISELDICVKRRGEATALFLDDLPTYRYMAVLPYWLGRAQEGLGITAAARASFEQFLRIKSASEPDPLVTDARARATALATPRSSRTQSLPLATTRDSDHPVAVRSANFRVARSPCCSIQLRITRSSCTVTCGCALPDPAGAGIDCTLEIV